MNRKTILITAAAGALAVATAGAFAETQIAGRDAGLRADAPGDVLQLAARGPSSRAARPAPGAGGPGQMVMARRGGFGRGTLGVLEAFDVDGDGAVSQAEVLEARANRLLEFDTDGDGQLTLAEYQTLWLDAMREQMVDQFQNHDDDGNAIVTAAEFTDAYTNLILRLDRNDDGVFNGDDVAMQRERVEDDDDDGRRFVPSRFGPRRR